MATRARIPRAVARPVVAVAAAVIANPVAFGAGSPAQTIHESNDDSGSDEEASAADTAAEGDVVRDPTAAAEKDTPLGAFLRSHMAAHNSTLDQAVEAWRLSKPSSRTYKTAFRSIVKYWCEKGNVEWNKAWDKDVAQSWEAMCTTVKALIDRVVSFSCDTRNH